MSRLDIRPDDLRGSAIAALLREHLEHMHAITPAGSVHALDIDSLRGPGISFWSIWDGDELLGCGALKQLDPATGEIKSMRTAEAHRGRGVGSRMLEHIVAEARRRGYRRLLLETGAMPEFAAARRFYARHGFEPRGPFADYTDDPNSAFMSREI